jgi:DNA-binding Lrp family transcriptional regulator
MLINVEKEKLVIDLYYNQRKNVRQIAQEARISFRDIAAILKKINDDGSGNGIGVDNQQQQQKSNDSNSNISLWELQKTDLSDGQAIVLY